MFKSLSGKRARDLLLGLLLALAVLALIVWPQRSAAAARDGLLLCYNVIIPSLFPFFVLSSLVVELGMAGYIGRIVERIMRPLFNVPGVCASALVLGLIGGYPVGAQTAVGLYEKGLCSKTEAERLLAFCNTSGPAFILGVAGAGIFCDSRIGILLYLVHAAAAVCVGMVFRFYKRSKTEGRDSGRAPFYAQRLSTAFTGSVKNSFTAIFNICAFVVFFTVLIQMLAQAGILRGLAVPLAALGLPVQWGERLLTGVLEVSSGVWTLAEVGATPGSVSMAAFMLGWGGLSVHCQVLSFTGASGLSMRPYFVGKLLHGGVSALLAGALCRWIPLQGQESSGLIQQAGGFFSMDLAGGVSISTVAAGILWIAFFAAALRLVQKNSGKRHRHVV